MTRIELALNAIKGIGTRESLAGAHIDIVEVYGRPAEYVADSDEWVATMANGVDELRIKRVPLGEVL